MVVLSGLLFTVGCTSSDYQQPVAQKSLTANEKTAGFSQSVKAPVEPQTGQSIQPATLTVTEQLQGQVPNLVIVDSPVSGQLLTSRAGFVTSLRMVIGCDGKQRTVHSSASTRTVTDCIESDVTVDSE
jgi:hypothetical protein